jgi:hypothetical protein
MTNLETAMTIGSLFMAREALKIELIQRRNPDVPRGMLDMPSVRASKEARLLSLIEALDQDIERLLSV